MLTPRIVVSCEPEITDRLSAYSAVINVSDTPGRNFSSNGLPAFWFPIHETGVWGYTPFWGAAKTLDHIARFNPSKPVLIHCHGGVNRSPSVAYAIMASNDVPEEAMDTFVTHGRGRGLAKIYEANIRRGCVHADTIAVLRTRHSFPEYSLMGVLAEAKSPNRIHSGYKGKAGEYNPGPAGLRF